MYIIITVLYYQIQHYYNELKNREWSRMNIFQFNLCDESSNEAWLRNFTDGLRFHLFARTSPFIDRIQGLTDSRTDLFLLLLLISHKYVSLPSSRSFWPIPLRIAWWRMHTYEAYTRKLPVSSSLSSGSEKVVSKATADVALLSPIPYHVCSLRGVYTFPQRLSVAQRSKPAISCYTDRQTCQRHHVHLSQLLYILQQFPVQEST